ncbi:hypothetical protein HYH02_000688 [Chlamydomonas schloesseri]|uniref:carotenoid 9,10-dioxygenase n=1 Tax=Chlamydomonas schloesseri TaxID=2026947 RepID=A0A835WVM5_9CHLO|nr:hypothetical protein HYH02_000688 [Chlamydomonas schloesseri]|eukprot:KAG2454857.1 hypothetical protein HYH02_000688 [Chlamydomonas schloesseri]
MSSDSSLPQFPTIPRTVLYYAAPIACAATTALLFTARKDIITWVYNAIAKSGTKKAGKAYLSGNFGPVPDELFAEDLTVVEGKLPTGLEGFYVRVGPNPFFKPVAGYHWFDGDGMLHGVRLKGGKASYANKYVDTERLLQERAAGGPLFPRLGDLFGGKGLALMLLHRLSKALGAVKTNNGTGTANTALVFHAKRLLALNEGDLPYGVKVLCNGLIDTLGRMQLPRSWRGPFTAHPKLDPVTGELIFLGYSFSGQPYVSAGVLDEHGNLARQWGVELPWPVMMHDMVATEHYVVLMHLPLCFDPESMVKDKTLPFRMRTDLPSRIGLLRRDAPSCPAGGAPVQWFELPGPGFMAFHMVNAWEDPKTGDVKVYACQQDFVNLDLDKVDCSKELAHLTEYTLSPATGASSLRRLSTVVGDFPVVHPGHVTRPCRWAWVATMDTAGSTPSFTGIAKMDLTAPGPAASSTANTPATSPAKDQHHHNGGGKGEAALPKGDACVGRITYPPGVFGGEAVFVPRASTLTDAKASAKLAEDDGWLTVFVYDTNTDTSYFNVYDAKTMAAKPVASVRMPRRVPYGFHGTWVTEQQLKSQIMWV